MGRINKSSARTRIQYKMKMLKNTFRAVLKEDDLQHAFDELWKTWATEMAAMVYADILSVMDLILLTSVVDNKREIMKLKKLLNLEYENIQIQSDVESIDLNQASYLREIAHVCTKKTL